MKTLLKSLRWRAGRSADASPVAYDPLDPGLVRDPYPLYRRLRDEDPVHRTSSGALLLTRYAHVVEALRHPLIGNAPASYAVVGERNRGRYVVADVAQNILPFMDDPQHKLPRRVVARAFHAHLRAHPLDLPQLARRRAAGLRERGEMEIIGDFATPFSLDVICQLLGVPAADAPLLKSFSEFFFYLFSRIPSEATRQEMDERLAAFRAYAGELVARRRAAPGSDFVSTLVAAADEAGIGDPVFLADTIILIFSDAVENVDRAIASCLHLLLSHPGQLARLRSEPTLLASVVEEALRFEAPAQVIARVVKADCSFAGTDLRRDQTVLLALGAANRDERRFADPDNFDIGRSDNPHLAFGNGHHACIGGALVQREVQAALTALLELGTLRLVEAEPSWLARPGHRWLERLPLRCERVRTVA